MLPIPITIPLLNPNEPVARLASLPVQSGQYVTLGATLCVLETTKSTQELVAEVDGYVVGLTYRPGDSIQAGDVLCYLADSSDWIPPSPMQAEPAQVPAQPAGLRISQPALLLAQKHNLDLAQLPADTFITEKMVLKRINRASSTTVSLPDRQFESNSIIIYGGGGHGKALIDLINVLNDYALAGIVDDGLPIGSEIMSTAVLGGGSLLEQLFERGIHLAVNAVGGIGDIGSRIKVFERLSQSGFTCPTLIHPTAYVEPSAKLIDGVQVMPHAYVGSEAQVGYGVIINTGVIVSHDCTIGDYANLSPGAILAGEVDVGQAVLVGMGVTVNLRVKIGANARIGNGATVKQDVPDGGVVHAGAIWPT